VRIFGLTQKKKNFYQSLARKVCGYKMGRKNFPSFSRLAKLKLKKLEEERVHQGFRQNIGKKS
jgi:hypothetical protein